MKNDLYHRYLYRQMDQMLTITQRLEEDAKRYIPYCADRIQTLYYGVKAPEHATAETRARKREELGLAQNDFVAGLFGRLETFKGQHLLIKALARARKERNLQIRAVFVGHEMTAGYTDTLKQLANDLGVGDRVVFTGFVQDPQTLMHACECVVLATYEETFGLVLAEAMRAGVCVVGSNKGGVPEIIEQGRTGLLFESRDADSLCEALTRLASEPGLRDSLALAGKRKADALFNEDAHFEKLQSVMKGLLTAAGKTGASA